MALTFPLSLSDFADTLGIRQVKWWLQDNRELSGLGSGQILQTDLAPALWQGEVALREWHHADSVRIEAKINAMIRSQGTFYLYDPRHQGPALDPNGTTLGSSTVKIKSIADNKSMSLKGLPAAYKLRAGDYLAFDYGSNPTRRAFHQLAEDATADGSGDTGTFEVSPFIRTDAAVDNNVTLIKPAMKCIIMPGSLDVASTSNIVTTQISFSVVQKL